MHTTETGPRKPDFGYAGKFWRTVVLEGSEPRGLGGSTGVNASTIKYSQIGWETYAPK